MRRSVLRRLYDEALAGSDLPALGSPTEAARRVQSEHASRDAAAHALVRRHALLSGVTGFACGLPGYLTMPVTIPANLAGVALLQLHLCATIAALAGRDPADETTRRRCIACVLDAPQSGSASTTSEENEEREGLFRRLASKVGERGLRFAGEQAFSTLAKGSRSLPLLGGAVGGFSDARSTQAVGRRAQRAFLDTQPAR